jgi:alkanesulfonate monooxygenase SsuD/methylene tetrahydromethanopterin reductase-like flavin-dependent oxidoreductase (luciferase family)
VGRFPLHDFDTMNSTIAICGSPAEVVDRMGEAREALHLDTHILMLDMGGIPDDELFPAIELAGAEVLPQLRGSVARGWSATTHRGCDGVMSPTCTR